MTDKLPPIYLKLFGGKLDFCGDEDPEYVIAYPRESDATIEHCGGPVAKYEPAVPRCKTCDRLCNSGMEFNVGNGVISECEFLSCLDNPNMKLPQDGSGYCSNHPDVKP
jgi:hypothetical protein